MAVLIFLGIHLVFYSTVSTGPNLDLSIGWLELHRHGDSWTVERLHLGWLFVRLLSSVFLTWLLSKMLRRRMA